MNLRARGFTLAELAVTLTVLSLIIGILAAPVAARIEASQRRAADAMLDDIVDALVGFALLHGRLPCPSIEASPAASGYGLEQGPPCVFATTGYLPWRSLGLPVHDPWGRPRASAAAPWDGHWRYRPDRRFAEGVITLATQPVNHIQIRDHDGNPLTTADSRAIAVVYSTGPNLRSDGLNAAWSSAAPVFETGEATAAFDDRLRWIGHPFLIARLAQGGRL